jgi:hypothetical protein
LYQWEPLPSYSKLLISLFAFVKALIILNCLIFKLKKTIIAIAILNNCVTSIAI